MQSVQKLKKELQLNRELTEFLDVLKGIAVSEFHILEKKNTVSNPPKAIFHHNQLPAIPFFATSSVTASGVSAAKVVATIAVPARYQGRFLPDRKNCFRSFPAARV